MYLYCSPSTSWYTPAMTICLSGFQPFGDKCLCFSGWSINGHFAFVHFVVLPPPRHTFSFPSLSPNTALNGTIRPAILHQRDLHLLLKRMLHVNPGFTAYKSRSNDGSSIVMLTGIPVPVCGDVKILFQSGIENMCPCNVSNSTRKRGSLARSR